ncbi:efflux RND transporter periplasmic adaptor subunit [Parathalassolituus penaei]|uniref:Efflux RND transporter periplasmic adaptor subunit n=1 Tax=Parathalassolituus penaei TaxID=2997323 RepID=A0A9X3EF70_9GAMM|nr:efflux RND transporter periplasmic adaptor subunit [Parathalassolituus penaei]MCY0966483.1 efflux RND transporter periplasmic adaptor subunit [Parathalassolituus penaei]
MSKGLPINRGYMAAIILVAATSVWMMSAPEAEPEPVGKGPLPVEDALPSVQTKLITGQPRQTWLTLSGRTEPGRSIQIKAEIKARVISIHKQKGDAVKTGDVIMELDQRDWPARVKQAEANLRQRQIEHKTALKLYDKGLTNDAQLAQVATLLASAEAELTSARRQLDATRIIAPFAGIINDRKVEQGDYLQEGQVLVQLLDFTPWIVSAQVPARDIGRVQLHQKASARLSDGQTVTGKIRFVAAEADAATRSFRVELAVDDNQPRALAGLSADLLLPTGEQQAFHLSPALLLVDDQGRSGVKVVNAEQAVEFAPVNLLEADADGIWVISNNSQLNLITRGAGYVRSGQTVISTSREDQHARAD